MDVLGMVQSEPSKFTFGESFTLIALSLWLRTRLAWTRLGGRQVRNRSRGDVSISKVLDSDFNLLNSLD
jgi:hypothetical protein